MSAPVPSPPPRHGGVAQFFVEHREVGWMLLVAVLVWGGTSYFRLAQQEDPKIPHRTALLVTRFPGATASQVEQLVTRKLERKVSELESVHEIKSQSRAGVSVITVAQQPARVAKIDQEWDKLRAKLGEVALPQGCLPPALDTDFGNTITLLFALTSPVAGEAENLARAELARSTLAELRHGRNGAGRAAVFAFFPPAVADSYRRLLSHRFLQRLETEQLGSDVQSRQGESYIVADFATETNRAGLQQFVQRFVRAVAGSDNEMHPDFGPPLILMGDEDPFPVIRTNALPRYSYRQLEDLADKLEDTLKQVPSAGRVRQIGAVPEAVYLMFSLSTVVGYNLSSLGVLDSVAKRNDLVPGGILRTEGQALPVQLSGAFSNEAAVLDTVLSLTAGGLPVYLRDVFEVRRGYENPIAFSADVLQRNPAGPLERRRSVLVAAEMKEGAIIGRFHDEVLQAVAQMQARLPDGVEIVTLSDQPAAVAGRIHQFMKCFLEAVLIVIGVALFLMNWRSALVVATAIPLTVAMTLGGMHALGLPLHQISIAALIIALGMLVDDPVVASDGINRELAHGHPRGVAAWLGPYKLRRPILFGTVINIVAFLPLVLLPGDKGAFIVALPIVITLALISSRIVSMTFIPLLGFHLLRGQKGLEAGGEIRSFPLFRPVDQLLVALLPRYQRLLAAALDHPLRAAGLAYGLLLLSFGLVPFFGSQFFPPAERNQFLIDVELPETASVIQTRRTCDEIIRRLNRQPEIASAAVFLGGTAPRFYYNVAPREPGGFLAQVLVNTRRAADVPPLLARLRDVFDHEIAGARVLVKQLEQGPPVDAPIQIRVSGEDLDRLREIADRVAAIVRRVGAYKVRDDLGKLMPTVRLEIDQDRANTLGIDNAKIGRITQAAFAGLKATEIREGDHLIPVYVRLRVDERSEIDKIRSLYVEANRGQVVPFSSIADVKLAPEYAIISHFNQLRAVTVKAWSVVGELPSRVLQRARPELAALGRTLPPGYRIEFAGEAKELRESRAEMGVVMQVSLGLIALAMVIQFGSVVKSLVVMLTVPLGLIGAFVGMAVLQTSFGFMALLGMVSLAGVIVSHIIVLSDFIEEARAEGMELKAALMQAGLVRLRAVLVTVLATVGGLIPLALTGGELWRPLTAVHIFGLLLATVLTLVLLPVLYYLFCARLKWIK